MLNLIIWFTRLFYILSSLIILFVRLVPDLKDRFLSYGARDDHTQTHTTGSKKHDQHHHQHQQHPSLLSQLLDHVETWKVPHSWFIHFYILSLLLSTTCIFLIITTSLPLPLNNDISTETTNTTHLLCSILMFIQSIRRSLECFFLTATTKPAKSKMWIGHYLIGLAFYFLTNLGIYVEYLEVMNKNQNKQTPPPKASTATFTSTSTIIYTLLFLYCSYKQNVLHRYLASLKKYTLPDHGIFKIIVAPHYTAECGIYFSLVLLQTTTTPDDHGGRHVNVNWSLVCALLFVMVNLGITADGTRKWMMNKFPERRKEVEARYRMIPPLW